MKRNRYPPLQPSWLVSLLVQWGKRESYGKEIGWYHVNPSLKSGIPIQARSYEPTGFSEDDFGDLVACLELLPEKRMLAIIRYCKPWNVRIIDAEHPLDTDTWRYHLKAGLWNLSVMMDLRNAKRA